MVAPWAANPGRVFDGLEPASLPPAATPASPDRGFFAGADLVQLPLFVFVAFKLASGFDEPAMLIALSSLRAVRFHGAAPCHHLQW